VTGVPGIEQCWHYRLRLADHILLVNFKADTPATDAPNDTEETTHLLKQIADNEAIKVVVFVGTEVRFGPARLSKEERSNQIQPDARTIFERTRKFLRTLVQFDKPIVSALTGDARPPLGLTIALLSDFIVAEEQIRLSDPHIELGVVSASSAFAWPVSVGVVRAKRYIMTGEPITATEAERIGLVTEVVAAGAAEGRALEFAHTLAGMDPMALAHTKRALNLPLSERLQVLDATMAAARLSGN
jgi:enoyl-CoA hydratase